MPADRNLGSKKAITCDAFHQTASSPNGEGAYRAMSLAIQQEIGRAHV